MTRTFGADQLGHHVVQPLVPALGRSMLDDQVPAGLPPALAHRRLELADQGRGSGPPQRKPMRAVWAADWAPTAPGHTTSAGISRSPRRRRTVSTITLTSISQPRFTMRLHGGSAVTHPPHVVQPSSRSSHASRRTKPSCWPASSSCCWPCRPRGVASSARRRRRRYRSLAGLHRAGETDKNFDWVTEFEKKTGCKVRVKTANTSDEMVSLMNQGGFDLVTASGRCHACA